MKIDPQLVPDLLPEAKFKVGDEVAGWGIGFPAYWYKPGKVSRVEWNDYFKHWEVDWGNDEVQFACFQHEPYVPQS